MALPDTIRMLFSGFPEAALALGGTALVALALWLSIRNLKLARGKSALGRIVGYRLIRDSESADSYGAIFRFRPDRAPEEIEVHSQAEFRAKPGPVGEVVEVRYDPANPARADIARPARLWAGVAAVLVLGAGTLLAAWQIGAGR